MPLLSNNPLGLNEIIAERRSRECSASDEQEASNGLEASQKAFVQCTHAHTHRLYARLRIYIHFWRPLEFERRLERMIYDCGTHRHHPFCQPPFHTYFSRSPITPPNSMDAIHTQKE